MFHSLECCTAHRYSKCRAVAGEQSSFGANSSVGGEGVRMPAKVTGQLSGGGGGEY